MSKFKLEQNVTSLEDSKRLAEAGIDLEADCTWEIINKGRYDEREPTLLRGIVLPGDAKCKKGLDRKIHIIEHHKAYRLDRLLAELPEWCFKVNNIKTVSLSLDLKMFLGDDILSIDPVVKEVCELILKIQTKRGQEAIKACVDLLILLKDTKENV